MAAGLKSMRSKLFVPGSRAELFLKALAAGADAVSFDLEDAVAEEWKAQARGAVADFIASDAVQGTGKIIIVRTNALDSRHFHLDIAAVARDGVDLINLPKIESADSLRAAVGVIEDAERANGVDIPIGLLVNIETPEALENAASIAVAHPRVRGLQLGLGDMFEPYGIDRSDPRNVHAVLFEMRMATAQSGVFLLDGAFPILDDIDGYTAEARMSRSLGFVGKTCVHPRQVVLANKVFSPSETELAQARRIVETARTSSSGVFAIDGRMVDAPFLRRAEAVLASAQRVD